MARFSTIVKDVIVQARTKLFFAKDENEMPGNGIPGNVVKALLLEYRLTFLLKL